MTGTIREKADFYLGLLKNPKRIGAIAPTSIGMARKMANPVRPDSELPVLELGPGTGAITRAILERGTDPTKLFSIEYTPDYLPGLRQRYPGVNFIHGDAFDIARIARELGIEEFDTIVSALPLLNFEVEGRTKLVDTMLDLLPPGRPMVQFSYRYSPPVPAHPDSISVSHLGTVFRNLPPAQLWEYRRCQSAGGRAASDVPSSGSENIDP